MDDPGPEGEGLYAEHLFNAIAGNWERKRPVGVPVLDLDLDLDLAQEAGRTRKRTSAIEKVEEQGHPLRLTFSQVSLSPPFWTLGPGPVLLMLIR